MNGRRPGGWVALAWRWERDPKIAGLSPAAKLLWLRGLCVSCEQESDGKVLRKWLTDGDRKLAKRLVERGLWLETLDGWAIPFDSFARWQDTAEQRAVSRARNAQRQANWRRALRVTNSVTDGQRNAAQGQGQVAPYGATPVPTVADVEESESWIDADGRLFVRSAREAGL